ncbi:MAG: serine hydroxymethyltransferase [Patescibacteria group bacterium]
MNFNYLKKSDSQIYNLISSEARRQKENINLIASENFVSEAVLEALGSVFTNKYAEGYSGARYYAGNIFVDKLEDLTKGRALKLFIRQPTEQKNWDVNVQCYSGTPANLAVYHALVPLGEKIMGMRLDMGGHLSHGHKASITGKLWQQVVYGVDQKTEILDYDEILEIAKREKPKLIVCGYSAYSRIIDFKKFRAIADEVGAILMIDMAHFAGLVAGGVYPSPFKYADIVTTTTHKTLTGPRSALIFSKKEFSPKIDKVVFPGLQGGPHMNQIAAVAVALEEASKPAFKKYAEQVVKNAKALADAMQKLGWRIISGGTDTHLFLVDVWQKNIGGKEASELLEKAGIIVNKNAIPYDSRSPIDPSGIRLGAPAITTRGMKEKEIRQIAGWIDAVLTKRKNYASIKKEVLAFLRKF